ncbi:MAG TPA: 2-oxoacid:acceptor oxidoreductase family protein [Opitutaceae bacterium]|nr:2-oxoacid:acceptor oxidoreductase family protein [Opitutaceae bacterium]
MSVFYDHFERHAHGKGLKGQSTHYCPGCGHGLVHRDLAEAIGNLGIQDRTILISPVGCSVFAHYYFDVGNSQAAHGRAPAVALGHKLANPGAIVVSYQGDGDLASIGLGETISIAQMGLPITVIFINNAIYGMTGGQMAPTSLQGQRTATSPEGRTPSMGQPLRMAELIAGLDGPIYVERVALFDARQRKNARRAIEKALQLQIDGRGYSFIEVLAECPLHLRMTPAETEEWVKTVMEPVFPLGVKKDVSVETHFEYGKPSFNLEEVLGLSGAEPAIHGGLRMQPQNAMTALGVGIKFAGAGGDGAQTAALLVARAAIAGGYDATQIPSYGPESRGGTSYADVQIVRGEVLNPAAAEPDILVAFNAQSLAKFAGTVREGGTILYDSTVILDPRDLPEGRRIFPVPFTAIAKSLNKLLVKNTVAVGALQAATGILPAEVFLDTIRHLLRSKPSAIPINEAAFSAGRAAVAPVLEETGAGR